MCGSGGNQLTDAALSLSLSPPLMFFMSASLDAERPPGAPSRAAVLRRVSQTEKDLLVLLTAYLQDLPPTSSIHRNLARITVHRTHVLSPDHLLSLRHPPHSPSMPFLPLLAYTK